MDSAIFEKVKKYLKEKYSCHSVILYGSFAVGTQTEESDIDVIGFSDHANEHNDNTYIEGWQLDAWIFDTKKMYGTEELLHIKDGKILLDENYLCVNLLNNINELYQNGPIKLSEDEIKFQRNWLIKMLKRAKRQDTEGNYRFHWLLVDSLEIYFSIIRKWYLGPKKSLTWLKENDEKAYNYFDKALNMNTTLEEVDELITFIVNR
ncbi:MAG: putative nucleotidyltransferase [Haloplasmataceae bacterium]|jgi:predicted nucleotidyltransferase|nr:putative nucleotidyltransferase [Haloplasmataceae bacterium]